MTNTQPDWEKEFNEEFVDTDTNDWKMGRDYSPIPREIKKYISTHFIPKQTVVEVIEKMAMKRIDYLEGGTDRKQVNNNPLQVLIDLKKELGV